MDAKSKADFINKVAGGEVISCSACGAANKPGNKFCSSCGKALGGLQNEVTKPSAFGQTPESNSNTAINKYVEPKNVFAQGLPDWNIEPPQVVVRRK